jgi:hypothetical protein
MNDELHSLKTPQSRSCIHGKKGYLSTWPKIMWGNVGRCDVMSRGSPFNRQIPASLKALFGGMMAPSLKSSITDLPNHLGKTSRIVSINK